MIQFEETLSYDDVLLVPGYADFLPGGAKVQTQLTKKIRLNVPILAAAMDTVSEDRLAIALALEGGAAVIHRNLSPQVQAEHVGRVKRYLNWVIENPVVVRKGETVDAVQKLLVQYGVSGLPVVDHDRKLVGIITGRDLRFCSDYSQLVDDVMTKAPKTVRPDQLISETLDILNSMKVTALFAVEAGKPVGIIHVHDLLRAGAA